MTVEGRNPGEQTDWLRLAPGLADVADEQGQPGLANCIRALAALVEQQQGQLALREALMDELRRERDSYYERAEGLEAENERLRGMLDAVTLGPVARIGEQYGVDVSALRPDPPGDEGG